MTEPGAKTLYRYAGRTLKTVIKVKNTREEKVLTKK